MKRELEDDPPSPSIDHVLPAPPQLQVTVNANTINNYFSATPPVAVADARPAHLFPTNSERRHKTTVIKDRKACSVYISDACRDGTLKAGCMQVCRNQWVAIERFAPAEGSHITAAKHTKFFQAYGSYQQAFKDGNKPDAEKWRAVIEALRNNKCDVCAASANGLSASQQACKDEWETMKRNACSLNGGCEYQDCPERGEAAYYVLEADHGTNTKAHHLSDYNYWAMHGGVVAMRQEAQNIERWICRFCHRLEWTSSTGRRCGDPDTMPLGKPSGTPEEVGQYHARYHAVAVYPKYQYVDARKRATAKCAWCRRVVVSGQEQAFDWDHRDESTKNKGGLFGVNGGVSGLVNKGTQAAVLANVRALLDAEMDKCDLLCANCHARKTYGHPRREPVV